MTNQEILTQFESLVGDTLDQTLEIQLANNAKNKLEAEYQLEILKVVDTSQSSTVGGTYLTAYALPSSPAMLMPCDTIYVGTTPRRQIPFEQRVLYKESPNHFYIDWRNGNYYLTGTVASSETITFPYLYATTDISVANLNSTSVVWPARFHSLISYEMAFLWFAIDQGEKSRSFSPEWKLIYNELKSAFIAWDQKLKLQAIGGATPYGEAGDIRSENSINP